MRTVILGAGAAGIQLAHRLAENGKDVVLIERDPETVRTAANALDCLVIQGDGSSPAVLAEAGMSQAESFVALTGSDAVNIVACAMVSAEYPSVKRVARARNPYFLKLDHTQRQFMGVDRFFSPDTEVVKAFLSFLAHGSGENVVRFGEEDLELRSIIVEKKSFFCDRPLRESRGAVKAEFLVAALERDELTEIPSGNTVPRQGDLLYVLGKPSALDKVLGKFKHPMNRIRKAVIIGASPIGRLLAESLSGGDSLGIMKSFSRKEGIIRPKDIVLVEKSMELCKQASTELRGVLVLNRDIAEETIFEEENLNTADLFLAVSPNQEMNVLSAARAKEYKVASSLALVESSVYFTIAEKMGIDGIISLKTNIVSSIIEYLRGENLKTLHSFWNRGIKILEFTIPAHSPLSGKSIRGLRLPNGALVLFMYRQGRSFVPDGNAVIEPGDRLGIFTSMGAIARVEELFLEGGT